VPRITPTATAHAAAARCATRLLACHAPPTAYRRRVDASGIEYCRYGSSAASCRVTPPSAAQTHPRVSDGRLFSARLVYLSLRRMKTIFRLASPGCFRGRASSDGRAIAPSADAGAARDAPRRADYLPHVGRRATCVASTRRGTSGSRGTRCAPARPAALGVRRTRGPARVSAVRRRGRRRQAPRPPKGPIRAGSPAGSISQVHIHTGCVRVCPANRGGVGALGCGRRRQRVDGGRAGMGLVRATRGWRAGPRTRRRAWGSRWNRAWSATTRSGAEETAGNRGARQVPEKPKHREATQEATKGRADKRTGRKTAQGAASGSSHPPSPHPPANGASTEQARVASAFGVGVVPIVLPLPTPSLPCPCLRPLLLLRI